jgi:hypothetical protein
MKQFIPALCILLTWHFSEAQSVGVGTITPDISAQLEIKSSTGGLLLPRMTNTNRNAITNPPEGLTIFNTSLNRFEQYDGTAWKYFLDNDYWSRNGNYVYTMNNVGLGTGAPSVPLEVYGDIKITRGDLQLTKFSGTTNNIDFRFNGASSNALTQGFNFKINGASRSFFSFNHYDAVGEDQFRFGFSNFTTATLKSSGDFILNAQPNPTVQLRSFGVDKGFVQLAGDDLRVGTNSSNSAGQFYFRLNGSNQIFLNSNGYLKIGSGTPTARLDVDGDILTNGSISSTGNLITDNISFHGEIRKPGSTGTFSLVPLAYGFVDHAGNIINSTSNVSVTRVSEGVYEITVTGITSSCAIVVNGGETTTAAYYTTHKCRVTNYQDLTETLNDPNRVDTQFYFVIFQP